VNKKKRKIAVYVNFFEAVLYELGITRSFE
jgi:hypothetical protein